MKVACVLLALSSGACLSSGASPTALLSRADAEAAELPDEPRELLAIADAEAVQGPGGPSLLRSLAASRKCLRLQPEDAEALWRAARALFYQTIEGGPDAVALTQQCVDYGARASERSERAEAHFFYALCMGARARVAPVEGRALVKRMVEAAERALASDPSIQHGGPNRLLGGIYLRAPAWPASVGDPESAIENLERAVRIAPDWSENHLLLAEAYLAEDREEDGRIALRRARELLDDPAAAGWRPQLARDLRALEQQLAD